MKVHLHHPHAATHIPTHEQTARRHRGAAALPLARKSTPRPTPPAPGRKTVDTRFSNLVVPQL